jgi:hypothetical protein
METQTRWWQKIKRKAFISKLLIKSKFIFTKMNWYILFLNSKIHSIFSITLEILPLKNLSTRKRPKENRPLMKPKEWGKLFIKFFSAIYKSRALLEDRHFTFTNESIFKIYLYRSALSGREIKPLEWASN